MKYQIEFILNHEKETKEKADILKHGQELSPWDFSCFTVMPTLQERVLKPRHGGVQ